ncbi:monovalent cation:proton antiporter-2 (CPA2) family protein [Rhabdaerophilum sp. SD176]|uniref:monovalent cation:proton antiporter-2 (CPA2) family protein n=1 Tax=Rhabdaerophilum sp. SD176 TaxID=2983548 RepID=UPI0024DF74D9|nr:monovalent cation:proton antiporter-2 (CPA2) family protein [Rhabdaerophilum sp. SD176]
MADPSAASATTSTLVFLGAAVAAVPLLRFAGLSAVLGYLLAGIVIGPSGLGLFRSPDALRTVAELGIVMFLFVIGLELKPSKLVSMRRDILGLGLMQVLVTGIVLAVCLYLLGLRDAGLLAMAFAFALSATAIALQVLNERGALATAYGQKSFAVLLFQDMAIVPFIALMPLLAGLPGGGGMSQHLPDIALAFGALTALILAGRYLLNPFFRLLARADAREVMTAAALLVVLGAAEAMHAVGLSAALGAFVAGLMLAESNFRHQLEADIEPFRGLLLGLFFMSVGMSIDGKVVMGSLAFVLGTAVLVMSLKAALTYALLRIYRQPVADAVRASVLLSTIGEFSFVIIPLAGTLGFIAPREATLYAAIAAITMFLGPVLVKLAEPALARFAERQKPDETLTEDFDGAGGEVLVIGFGRFGQVANQMLLAAERNVTVIDRNIDRIRAAGRFGFKVYYGDGRRLDVLRAAGAEKAAVIAICIDDREAASTIAEMAVRAFPQAKLVVRAYDRVHALDLMERGVRNPIRETFEGALSFGRTALMALGLSEDESEAIREDIRRRDVQRLLRQRDEGILGGTDLLIGATLAPEPLSEPKRKGRDLTARPKPATPAALGEGVTGESS